MNKNGFSLLEVMVVVVIVGIIAAIAIPSYSGYVTRTRRADAITALETVALDEEKYKAEKGTYGDITALTAAGYPNPNADANRNYNIDVINVGTNTFTATATGMNHQLGDVDGYGNDIIFGINSDGTRGRMNGSNLDSKPELWKTLRP